MRSYMTSYKMPCIITRGNNVYGPHQFPEKLIPKMTLLASRGGEMPVHGDGKAVRSYLHVRDVARAFDTVLHKGIVGQVRARPACFPIASRMGAPPHECGRRCQHDALSSPFACVTMPDPGPLSRHCTRVPERGRGTLPALCCLLTGKSQAEWSAGAPDTSSHRALAECRCTTSALKRSAACSR